jgi:hypothetical protein
MRDTSNQTTSVTRYRVSLQLAGALASGDLGPEGVTTAHVDATTMNVGNLVAANAVSLTPGGAGGGETLTGVRFSASAYSGPLVEKRVADSARWGVGARGDATEVYAGVGGRVALGHALNDATVAEGLSVVRPVGAATANVGINAPSPVAALDVVGNVRCTAIQHRNWVSFPDQRFMIDPFRYTMQDRFSTLAGSELGTVVVTFSGARDALPETQFTNMFHARWIGQGWNAGNTYTIDGAGTPQSASSRVVKYFAYGSYVTDAFLTSGSGFAAATTAVRGPHVTFTFPYMLSLRYVQVAQGSFFDSTRVDKRDAPHEILAVGTDDAVVSNGTVWREIDTMTRALVPTQIARTTTAGALPLLWHYTVSKTQGLTAAYRTVRLIMYSFDDRNFVAGGHPYNNGGTATNTVACTVQISRMNLAGVRVPYTQVATPPSIPDVQAGAISAEVAASYEYRNPLSYQSFFEVNATPVSTSLLAMDISGNYRNIAWAARVGTTPYPTHLTSQPSVQYSANIVSRSSLTVVDVTSGNGYSVETLFRVTADPVVLPNGTDHPTPVLFSYTGLSPQLTLAANAEPLGDGVVVSLSPSRQLVATFHAEWPPAFVNNYSGWTKDANDRVTSDIDGVQYRKYKNTLSGASYGNGQYAAWSNTVLGYTDAAAVGTSEWPASGAVDKLAGSDRNRWATAGQTYTNTSDASTPPRLVLQLPVSIVLSGYSLLSGFASAQAPSKWEVHGSNNGSDWTLLDSRSNVTWGPIGQQTRVYFPQTVGGAFSYFRLTVYRSDSAMVQYIVVAEWRLYSLETSTFTLQGIPLGDAGTPTSGWHHAVFVSPSAASGRSPAWYVNGSSVSAFASAAPGGRTPAVYSFARHFSHIPGALCPRNGNFALGRFFTEALTSQQVTALYAAARRDGNPYALPG